MIKLILRNLRRRPLRTTLTVMTVMAAVLVFAGLLAVDRGVGRMVERTGSDAVVIVFERYKACPPYSRLPVHYAGQIAQVPGVREVMPVRFLLSSCQTTPNLVAMHGIEPDRFRRFREIRVPEDQYQAFVEERGAALVGRAVADRFRWRVGDTVTVAELRGITFVVRGIFEAPGSSLESVILVDRRFLEYAIDQVGVVTLFAVLVEDPARIDEVCRQIDGIFANYPAQTRSGPEKDFIVGNLEDFMHLVEFSRLIAWLALLLVLAAVSNSISMSVRERLREMALLRIRGLTPGTVVGLTLAESAIAAAAGAGLGVLVAAVVLSVGRFSIGVEGYTIVPHLSAGIVTLALAAGVVLGLAGAVLPAVHGARLPVVAALREVN